MSEHIKLTREQVILLTFICVLGNIVYSHTFIDDHVEQAAWVASLLGILFIIPLAVWIFYLGKFCPKGTIFDMIESGLGKFPAQAMRVLFICINLAVAVAQLNMFTQMLNVFFLQFTPIWITTLVLIILGILFANGGIQSFARLAEMLSAFGVINYFAAFIFAFPKFFHIEYVLPIFTTSITGFLKATLFMMGSASECLLILMIIVRFVPDSAKHYMWVVKGIAVSSVIFSSAIFVIIGMMSPQLAKGIAFGGVNAARLIKIGDFLQGLEVLIFATYQYIAIGKVTLSLYCAWMSAKKISSKKPKLMLIIIAVMMYIPSIWLSSYNKAYYLAAMLANYILLPFCVFILLLASISLYIKTKRAGSVE